MNTKVLTLSLVVLAACGSSTERLFEPDPNPDAATVVAAVGETFRLKPGQSARIGDLVVGFRGVAQDSRCPVDVTCVWSGDAELRVPVAIGRREWTPLVLHTHVEPRFAAVGDYSLTVVGLMPDRKSDRKVEPEDYEVTLRVN